jgi:leader peptidase (prepilin peptidase)/N-methyltransferase
MITTPISSVVYGLSQKFIKEEELLNDEYAKEKKVKLKYQYNVWVLIVDLIIEGLLFYFKGLSVEFFAYSFLSQILIISAITDIHSCIIPNETNFVGFIVGIVYAFFSLLFDFKRGCDFIVGGITGFLIFFFIYLFSLLIFKKEGMGGGDIKLMGVIGLFMGFYNTIEVFVLSFFIGAIISIILLIAKRKNGTDYIPFGPFIVIATYIAMFVPATVLSGLISKLLYSF